MRARRGRCVAGSLRPSADRMANPGARRRRNADVRAAARGAARAARPPARRRRDAPPSSVARSPAQQRSVRHAEVSDASPCMAPGSAGACAGLKPLRWRCGGGGAAPDGARDAATMAARPASLSASHSSMGMAPRAATAAGAGARGDGGDGLLLTGGIRQPEGRPARRLRRAGCGDRLRPRGIGGAGDGHASSLRRRASAADERIDAAARPPPPTPATRQAPGARMG